MSGYWSGLRNKGLECLTVCMNDRWLTRFFLSNFYVILIYSIKLDKSIKSVELKIDDLIDLTTCSILETYVG